MKLLRGVGRTIPTVLASAIPSTGRFKVDELSNSRVCLREIYDAHLRNYRKGLIGVIIAANDGTSARLFLRLFFNLLLGLEQVSRLCLFFPRDVLSKRIGKVVGLSKVEAWVRGV